MTKTIWITCLCLLLFVLENAAAAYLDNCGGSTDDKYAEVIFGTTATFTCTLTLEEHNGQVQWRVRWDPLSNRRWVDTSAGVCPKPSGNTDTCSSKPLQPAFVPKRTSLTSSVITVDPSEVNNTRILTSGTLICQGVSQDSCNMDYIIPANGTCNTVVATSSSPWKPSTTCTITEGESTRKRYSCKVSYRKQGTSQDQWTSAWRTMTSNTLPTGDARCVSSSTPLPLQDGVYTFTTTLLPGRRSVDAGTIEIRRPTSPTITCNPPVVRENSNVTCTCTANVGQPAGSLRWRSGSYTLAAGGSPLTLIRPLTGRDHDSTWFRCELLWSDNINKSEQYTAKVSHPPSSVAINMGTSRNNQDRTVNENDDVTFTCTVTRGYPSADVTLSGPGVQSIKVTSQVPHAVSKVQCQNAGLFTCTAKNDFGPEVTSSATLYVTCLPRVSGTNTGEVNFIDQPVSISFDVIAYQLPYTKVTFAFMGQSGTDDAGAVDDDVIKMAGDCARKGESLYIATCTVAVENMTEEAAGVYQITVRNNRGDDYFLLTVKYRESESDGQSSVGPAVGGVLAAVVVVTGVVVVVVVVIKRRKGKTKGVSESTVSGRVPKTTDLQPKAPDNVYEITGDTGPSAAEVEEEDAYTSIPDDPQEAGVSSSDSASPDSGYLDPYNVLEADEIGKKSVYTPIAAQAKKPKSRFS